MTFADAARHRHRRVGHRRHRRRRGHRDQSDRRRLRLPHRGRHQEVRGHAAGALRPSAGSCDAAKTTWVSISRSPCPTPRPSQQASTRRGLLRDRARPAPRADELLACPARGRCCASTCSSPPRRAPAASTSAQTDLLDGTSVPTLMPDGVTRRSRSTSPTTWARSSRRRRTGRSGSSSTTSCPPARRGPVHPDGLHADGLGPRPDRWRMHRGRPRAPSWTRCATRYAPSTRRAPTASRTTGPRCTCTAASPRGSATARRTSGSPRPAKAPRSRGRERGERPGHGSTSPGVPDCSAPDDGCQTFYYTNQQSARLMFYHDHALGITRLNVYVGEAAGYLITDPTEQKLLNRRDHPGRHRSRSSSRTGPSCRTPRQLARRRIPPGTPPAGAATATSGTTTSTCRPRTRATRRA